MRVAGSFRSRDHEEQGSRFAVQRLEINASCALGEDNRRFVHGLCLGMGHGDSAADPRAGLCLALQNHFLEQHPVIDASVLIQAGDKLVDSGFLRRCLEIHDHGLFNHQVCNSHICQLL
ncbi:hypothetical protein D3C71_1515480 [compost metagenome]